jgi:DNA-binding transcriptional ArsR family regulator
MKIVKKEKEKTYTLDTREIDAGQVSCLNNPLSLKILRLLKDESLYPKQIARKLKVHEQNVYYYIHNLEKSKIIRVVKREMVQGTIAKFYSLVSDSFYVRINDFKESTKLDVKESEFLRPFIEDGKFNALIVVGSPDPHGQQKARSRDGYFGMDLALFFGTFLNNITEGKVKLDTEIGKNDLTENNLIVLGGPVVNKVAEIIGKKMPIYFDENKKGFYSSISKKLYLHEEIGVINKFQSPFNKKKSILFIAGIRNKGTKAAILAFLQKFYEIEKGNIFNSKINSRVVEGVDSNSDGITDSVEILE